MASRYDNRIIAKNSDEAYKDLFDKRGVRFIRQYRTGVLRHPSGLDVMSLNMVGHTWTVGDRYYKLAQQHYGDPTYWWVIAWFNQAPTEAHLNLGDPIQIPSPLERVLGFFDV